MLTLAHPWLLVLLPLPLLVWFFVPAHREPRQGLVVPFLGRLAEHTGQQPAEGAIVMRGGWLRRVSLGIGWICAVLAMSRPQVIEPRSSAQQVIARREGHQLADVLEGDAPILEFDA